MELRVLEYYLALAREGSVSGAAEVLHISQPTLSRQLIDLERELGTTLFERGRHGITLTEDGMLLRRRATEICDLVRITESEVMMNRGVVEGEIRIGCAETRAMDLVASVMHGLQEDHPGVTYRVTSGVAEDVVEQIRHGLVDFGLLILLHGEWNLGSLRLPTNERPIVVMRESCPLVALERVGIDDLVTERLVLPSGYPEMGFLAREKPRAEGGRLDVAATFGLTYNALRMVRAGIGCAVTLEGLVEDRLGSGLVTRPLAVKLDMPSYLVWKPFQLRTRACEAFLDRARERLGEGGGGGAAAGG